MFDIKNDKYWWGTSPTDVYTYRLNLFENQYNGVVLDYWNAAIISSLVEGNVTHELKFEYQILSKPDSLSNINLNEDVDFRQYLSDIIVDVIHQENGELELNFNTQE